MDSAFDNINVHGSAMAHDRVAPGGAFMAPPLPAAAPVASDLLASVAPAVFLALLADYPGSLVLKTDFSDGRTRTSQGWRYVFTGSGIVFVCLTRNEMDIKSAGGREIGCLGVLYQGKILGRNDQA